MVRGPAAPTTTRAREAKFTLQRRSLGRHEPPPYATFRPPTPGAVSPSAVR
jgi:hypothetical protein